MIKTLKWIYRLGYKHAENKLYHQMMARAKSIYPNETELFGIKEKSDYTKAQLQQRQDMSWKLQQDIEDVFHPTAHVTQEQIEKNRFEL